MPPINRVKCRAVRNVRILRVIMSNLVSYLTSGPSLTDHQQIYRGKLKPRWNSKGAVLFYSSFQNLEAPFLTTGYDC